MLIRYAAWGDATKNLALVFVSATAALFVTAAALFVLAAGGHGWNSSVLSATSLLTGPAGAVAWWKRGVVGKRIAAGAIIVNLLADGLLLVLTAREGAEYLVDTWAHVAPLVLAWAGTWALLQVLPFAAATRSRASPQR